MTADEVIECDNACGIQACTSSSESLSEVTAAWNTRAAPTMKPWEWVEAPSTLTTLSPEPIKEIPREYDLYELLELDKNTVQKELTFEGDWFMYIELN